MFAVEYRNTQRGAMKTMAGKLEEERKAKLIAQRIAWQRGVELAEMREIKKRESLHKAAEYAAEQRRQGIRYRRHFGDIEALACRIFKVTKPEIRSNRRNKHLVFARQFVMYWACRLTPLSLPQIGRLIGGRDHTTVLAGKRAYVKKRATMGRYIRDLR